MESINALLAILRNVSILAMLVFLVWQGATRWVRRLLVLVLGILLAETGLNYGLSLTVQLFLYLVSTIAILITLSILAYRIPISSQFIQVSSGDYPAYALKKLDKLTRQFSEKDFIRDADIQMHYYFFSKRMRHWIRFMRHPDLPVIAEIHVTQIPRSIRCIILSISMTELWVTTQGYADIQMSKRNCLHLNSMPSNTSPYRLINGHQAFIEAYDVSYIRTDRPDHLHEKMMNEMMSDLVVDRQLVRRGDTLVIPLRLIPGAILRTLSGWMK